MTAFGVLCFAGAMSRGGKADDLTYDLAAR